MQEWLASWVESHSEWKFLKQVHSYFEYFKEAPSAQLGPSGELQVILCGTSVRKRFWRDWYVRVCRELVAAFPSVGKVALVRDV
ncbi:MAG: hypothetical protein CMJ48_11465 [Planctomycetaceae bacterium]|nr:hypothetical protein [Planctomycetaceae bacterium]